MSHGYIKILQVKYHMAILKYKGEIDAWLYTENDDQETERHIPFSINYSLECGEN